MKESISSYIRKEEMNMYDLGRKTNHLTSLLTKLRKEKYYNNKELDYSKENIKDSKSVVRYTRNCLLTLVFATMITVYIGKFFFAVPLIFIGAPLYKKYEADLDVDEKLKIEYENLLKNNSYYKEKIKELEMSLKELDKEKEVTLKRIEDRKKTSVAYRKLIENEINYNYLDKDKILRKVK